MCFKPLKELGKRGMVPPLHLCLAPIWRIGINNVNVDYIFLSFPIWNKSTISQFEIVWQIEFCEIIVYNFLHFKYFVFNRKGIPTVTNRPSHRAVRRAGSMCFWEIKMCLRPDASGYRVTPPLLRLSKRILIIQNPVVLYSPFCYCQILSKLVVKIVYLIVVVFFKIKIANSYILGY